MSSDLETPEITYLQESSGQLFAEQVTSCCRGPEGSHELGRKERDIPLEPRGFGKRKEMLDEVVVALELTRTVVKYFVDCVAIGVWAAGEIPFDETGGGVVFLRGSGEGDRGHFEGGQRMRFE